MIHRPNESSVFKDTKIATRDPTKVLTPKSVHERIDTPFRDPHLIERSKTRQSRRMIEIIRVESVHPIRSLDCRIHAIEGESEARERTKGVGGEEGRWLKWVAAGRMMIETTCQHIYRAVCFTSLSPAFLSYSVLVIAAHPNRITRRSRSSPLDRRPRRCPPSSLFLSQDDSKRFPGPSNRNTLYQLQIV